MAAPAPDSPAAVRCSDVRRTYPAPARGREPVTALHGVSLDVPAGQSLALLGPNGSGKSTLLKILATLDRPDPGSGPVEILGLPLTSAADLRTVRSRLGVVFQAPGLDPLLTVRENLTAAAALYGLRGREAADRAARLLDGLGLTPRAHDRVRTLSGGLARRADLARALLHDPDLLLLDEPTAALDPRARAEFLAVLDNLRAQPRDAGRPPLTIITSTHTMDEAQRASRVVLLHRGRIVADGAPDELRRRLGGLLLRCPALDDAARSAAAVVLRDAGLEPAQAAANGELTAAADRPELLERALGPLARQGIPFEVGPPTLADVFLSLTGEALHSDAEPEPSPHARRSRRR